MRSSSSKQWSWTVALLAGSAWLATDARAADPREWGDESAAQDDEQPEKHAATPALADAATARLDLVPGLSGLFFGVGADYGL